MTFQVFKGLAALWLLFNFLFRAASLHTWGGTGNLLIGFGLAVFIAGYFRAVSMRWIIFLFGLTLPLYGFQPYAVQSQVFEFWLVILAGLFLYSSFAEGRERKGQGIGPALLGGYVLLAVLSLLELPLAELWHLAGLWEWGDLFKVALAAQPENPLFSVLAVNRLVLFFCLILFIHDSRDGNGVYRSVLTGCGIGALVACVLGLLNQAGIFDLSIYRPDFLDGSGAERLQSVFGNPGWFAEYTTICFPLLLYFTCRKQRLSIFWFFMGTMLVGGSLFLTGSRTSWLVFLILLAYTMMVNGLTCSGKTAPRKMLIQAAAAFLVAGVLAGGMYRVLDDVDTNSPAKLSRSTYLSQRVLHIGTLSERRKLWPESVALIREQPFFGLGYGTYRWHTEVMDTIPQSRFSRARKTTLSWETPHNLYLQLLADNGFVGLCLWLCIAGYAAFLLGRDLLVRRNIFSGALLGMLAAFHLYGMSQAMQYVPSIWIMVFFIFGYAFWLETSGTTPPPVVWKRRLVCGIILCGTAAAAVVYGLNFESCRLADRYGMQRYETVRKTARYRGFYAPENWGRQGIMRWTGRRAEIVLSQPGLVRLPLVCSAPRLESDPITVRVLVNGRPTHVVKFSGPGRQMLLLHVPPTEHPGGGVLLELQISRTWSPRREGISRDDRNLGVAVGEPGYLHPVPAALMLLGR